MLTHTEIQDIRPISHKPHLFLVLLNNNQVKDISPLSTLKQLTYLLLDHNKVQDLQPLSSLYQLSQLEVAFNQIETLKPIQHLQELSVLNVNDNRIRDMSVLRQLPDLSTITVRNNPLDQASIDIIASLKKTTSIRVDADAISVHMNGQYRYFPVSPLIMNGSTVVPMRTIFEELGARIEWNEETRTVTATDGDREIQIVIGTKQAFIDGEEVALPTEAVIINDTTMVPVRFVSEALGAKVVWEEAVKTIHITKYSSH